MDTVIAQFNAVPDSDLMLCLKNGVAYQKDMGFRVEVPYFEKCGGYEGKDIALKINSGRVEMVNRHVGPEASVLDIGVGCGEFIKNRPNTFGFDVDPDAVKWLKQQKRWSDSFSAFDAFTFWDVLEHVEKPDEYFDRMHDEAYLFTSLPIFPDLINIRQSRHYRPGEHLYYFTEQGFIDWMWMHRFKLLEKQDFETKAGRDSILNFAFRRV